MTRFLSVIVLLAYSSKPLSVNADEFGGKAQRFQIEFVTVGRPGNHPNLKPPPNPAAEGAEGHAWMQEIEPRHGSRGWLGPKQLVSLRSKRPRIGGVQYLYRVGKYEVSREMISLANRLGNLAITMSDMKELTRDPDPQLPATGISWTEAARFVNWLNASSGYPRAYNFSTRPGELKYSPYEKPRPWPKSDAGYQASRPLRHRAAFYFLPSRDEWYKAACYDPKKTDGNSPHYWIYPTGSDNRPRSVAMGNETGTAVYHQDPRSGPAPVNQCGGCSPWGAMGMAGNVWEWEEQLSFSCSFRGGAWNVNYSLVAGTSCYNADSIANGAEGRVELVDVGFRVASKAPPAK